MYQGVIDFYFYFFFPSVEENCAHLYALLSINGNQTLDVSIVDNVLAVDPNDVCIAGQVSLVHCW